MSSIKDYISSMEQDDWIDYIIESLLGTSDSLSEYQDEYVENGFNESDLLQAIDVNIWLCEDCGWWVEVSETNEDGICEDCRS